MARCTAPVRGHIRGGGADCPACSGRYGGWGRSSGYSSYREPSYTSYTPSYSSSGSSGAGRSSRGGARRTAKPRWSGAGSAMWYTPEQVQQYEATHRLRIAQQRLARAVQPQPSPDPVPVSDAGLSAVQGLSGVRPRLGECQTGRAGHEGEALERSLVIGGCAVSQRPAK